MNKTDRQLLRAAVAIQDRACRQGPLPGQIHLPEYAWTQIQRLKRQIALAQERGWHLAASSLATDLAQACRDFHRQLDTVFRDLAARNVPGFPPSVSAVYQDLRALRHEFGEVEIDLKAHELAVTTNTVQLDGILLGEFEIRLNWSDIRQVSQPYRVVALDPHPAARREDVTHPHVQDERLCEGEGRAAIATALADSRFYDFFLLVDQILHNYGRGGGYVELDAWDGVPCSDCGTSLGEDDRYYCHACNSTLCVSCSPSCPGCDNSFCSSCLRQCAACGYDYCSNCLESCTVCRKRFCENCREGRVCASCYEELHPEEPQNDTSNDSPAEATCLAGQTSEG
jgi:hypothetical protein